MKKGSIILEIVLSIAIITIFLSFFYPILKINFFIKNSLYEKSSEKEILVLLENIGNLILSTTIEKEEIDNSYIKNRGIAVLKLGSRNLSNINLDIGQYILKNNETGDGLYIEIPEVCIGEKIFIGNQFYIYRVVQEDSQNGSKSQIRFVKGRENFTQGSRDGVLKLGKEEILNSNIEFATFKEVFGGIEFKIQEKEGKNYKEIFLKNGEIR